MLKEGIAGTSTNPVVVKVLEKKHDQEDKIKELELKIAQVQAMNAQVQAVNYQLQKVAWKIRSKQEKQKQNI